MIVVTSEYKMNFIHVFQIIINDLILCLCTKYCTCCKIRYFTFWQCTWTFGFWCSTFLQYHTFVKNPKHIEFEDKLHNDTTNMLSIWIICLVYLKTILHLMDVEWPSIGVGRHDIKNITETTTYYGFISHHLHWHAEQSQTVVVPTLEPCWNAHVQIKEGLIIKIIGPLWLLNELDNLHSGNE